MNIIQLRTWNISHFKMNVIVKYILLLTIPTYSNCVISVDDFDLNKLNLKTVVDLYRNNYYRLNVTDDDYLLNINSKYNATLCNLQIMGLINGLNRTELWALTTFDAWGKFPSGILQGNKYDLGHFDECLSISDTTHWDTMGTFNGQYCLLTIGFKYEAINRDHEIRMPNPELDSSTLHLIFGICIPSSCSPQMISYLIENATNSFYINVTNSIAPDTCSMRESITFRVADIIAICIFSLIAIFMVSSTVYDVLTRSHNNRIKILLIFSVYTNANKIFSCVRGDNSSDVLNCLNGIRVLSIIWVVYGHSHVIILLAPFDNPLYLLEFIQNPYSMLLFAATVSVDSFFLLSGLLVSWSILKQIHKRNGKITWKTFCYIFIHRYLRLTPALLATILFCTTLARYLGEGPVWKAFIRQSLEQPCENYWWSAILYVQNYVNPNKICLGHSWYLSVDMQLFAISPLLLYPLWKYGLKFIPIIIALIVSSMICVFVLFILNEFSLQLTQSQTLSNYQKKQELTYYPTHTRLGPWLVGILLGYYLYKMKNQEIHLSKIIIFIGWCISCGTILSIIFGLYPMQQQNYPISKLDSAFYESFTRVSWAISLSWIIFACKFGYGGPVNYFLSLSMWQPLARLSYAIYLVHFPIQILIISSKKINEHFDEISSIHKFWGDFGISTTIAILWALAFESPIIVLEKIIQTKWNAIRSTETT